MFAERDIGAEFVAAGLGDDLQLARVVAVEMIDRDDDGQAEFPHIADMPAEIGEPGLHRGMVLLAEIGLGHAALGLDRAQRRHDDRSGGLEPGLAAFDVEEFLGAEIGAEAGFGHDIIGEIERRARRDHRIAAMRDIGERAAMNEGGRAFERLHEIGHQRVLEQDGHRAMRLQISRGHRLLVIVQADDDLGEPILQIVEIAGEAEDRHDFGGDGDVEAAFARKAIGGAAERHDDADAKLCRSYRRRGGRRCGANRG